VPWQGFHETGLHCRVTERLSELTHNSIEVVLEIDESLRAGGPQSFPEFFTGNDLSGTFEQDSENAEGLLVQLNFYSVFP
jgi:hypothetical protein